MQNPAGATANPGSENELCCVIGSGPAGVACAQALLSRGRRVLMLDAGLTLEPSRQQLVESFRARSPEQWSAAELVDYKAGMTAEKDGVPVKLVYGSDYPYREAEQRLAIAYGEAGLRASLARGGLSNVWGAAMMPYTQSDIADWPITIKNLAEHYAASLELSGLAATPDALENRFPLYTRRFTDLRPSKQAERLLNTMDRHRQSLRAGGIEFGRSRLAVRGKAEEEGCVYCRLCMYGCPYGHIYSSAHSLPQLEKNAGFRYQGGVVVQSVQEIADTVQITGTETSTGKESQWQCRRAFVAAGPLPTTAILLRSLEAYDQPLSLKDSQYFLFPMLLLKKARGARAEPLHALSQIFLEMTRPPTEETLAHIQIYTNSDLISEAVEKSFGPLAGMLSPIVKDMQDRMLIAQGFLHSHASSEISVTLSKTEQGDRLILEPRINPQAAELARGVVWKLVKNGPRIGAIPLPPMLKITEPGRSFHNGGTFPMSRDPKGFQTDLLGRLPAWKRVHAVDSTVFPSIAPTTITFTIMANAHRIGWEAATLE